VIDLKCSICGYELDHRRNFIIVDNDKAICEKCYEFSITTVFKDKNGKEYTQNEVSWFPNINFLKE
jgi:ribosome-binding protein aMBF1 (putative translation factor)